MLTDDEINERIEGLTEPVTPEDQEKPPEEPWYRRDLRRTIERAGISQRELARRSNVGHSYISKIMAGKRRAPTEVFFRLSVALGEPPSKAYAWACGQLRVQINNLRDDGKTGFES
jgi:transcriptional regulator with XRE-family HTH domain